MTDCLGIICNAPLTPGRRSLAHSARGCALALLSRRDHFVAELWLITFCKLEANPFVKKGTPRLNQSARIQAYLKKHTLLMLCNKLF